ncbi:MAG: PAS domain S-box protein [Planctomycetaceae bacterium]
MSLHNADHGDLREAEQHWRLVVESSPAAMVITDQTGRIVLVNRQTECWFGFDRSELIGQEVEVLVPLRLHEAHKRDRNRFLLSPHARPMGAGNELTARRKDGSEFPVDISLHPFDTTAGPLVMAYVVDLTDRKQVELEAQRRHNLERLALLGQLAAGVSHEIRNPLGVIRNAAYYLQMIQESLDEEARASIAEIQQEVERANHIVGDLLDYARESPQRMCRFPVGDRVRQCIVNTPIHPGISIEFSATSEATEVMADPEQLDRIIQNLIRNAVQATEGGLGHGEKGVVQVAVQEDGEVVSVDVIDQGTGISPADRHRIFDPLFTTKAKGIGLGLAVSRRYAERNGGTLEVVDHEGAVEQFSG